jgi:hypothetical protein
MTRNDLARFDFAREIVLDCTKDGTVTYRNKVDRLPEGSLPFFTVASGEEARSLLRRLCILERMPDPETRNEWWRYPHFDGTLDGIDRLADHFRNTLFDMHERRQLASQTTSTPEDAH